MLDVREKLDEPIHDVLSKIPSTACNLWKADISGLTNQQSAEVKRFIAGNYDVVLGMLERRMDGQSSPLSSVRQPSQKTSDDRVYDPHLYIVP